MDPRFGSWVDVISDLRSQGLEEINRPGLRAIRVLGGFNNALYKIVTPDGCYGFKLCVQDARHRAEREFGVMKLLATRGYHLAPRPLGIDASCSRIEYPVVVYEWLDGETLKAPFERRHLAAIVDSYQILHRIRPSDELREAFFHWFNFEPYLEELGQLLGRFGPWLADQQPDGIRLRDRLTGLVESTTRALRFSRVDPGRDALVQGLCRVDPNPENAIWNPDGGLRWVDWEFSGWGDPALDLAEVRWHAQNESITAADHAWMRARYRSDADDNMFWLRVALWDRLLVTRWPFMVLRWWWSLANGPDRERLSMPVVDADELHARLKRMIQRAELFNSAE